MSRLTNAGFPARSSRTSSIGSGDNRRGKIVRNVADNYGGASPFAIPFKETGEEKLWATLPTITGVPNPSRFPSKKTGEGKLSATLRTVTGVPNPSRLNAGLGQLGQFAGSETDDKLVTSRYDGRGIARHIRRRALPEAWVPRDSGLEG